MCHTVAIFQKKTTVFLLHFQTRTFFSLNFCFNPVVISSEALKHNQGDQLNTLTKEWCNMAYKASVDADDIFNVTTMTA